MMPKSGMLFLALPRPKLLQNMTLKSGPGWGRRKISVCAAGSRSHRAGAVEQVPAVGAVSIAWCL